MSALMILAVASVILAGLSLLGMQRGWQALPGWLRQLQELDQGAASPPLPNLKEFMPPWALPAIAALTLIGTLINVWATLQARRAIGAVRDYTLSSGPQSAEELASSARTVRPWIILGQYAPILMLVFSLAITAAMLVWTFRAAPQSEDLGFGPLEGVFILISSVVQYLPSIIITWLILAAIRRWLDGVVARSAGEHRLIRPLARTVDPWLLFTVVLLILGMAGILFSALMFLFFPALITAAMQGETQATDTQLLNMMRDLFMGLSVLMLLSGAVYLLLTLLMAWSRGFAMNVATVLDAGLVGTVDPSAPLPSLQPQPAQPDPWSGPVQVAPPRDPR